MGAADTLVASAVLGVAGGIAAYVTNFMGFKVWADEHLIQQPPPPPPGNEPPVTNEPPPPTGTVTDPTKVATGKNPTPTPPRQTPNCSYMGSNCMVCNNPRRVQWKGICRGRTQYLMSNTFSTRISFQQACAQVAKDFVAKCTSGQTPTNRCPYSGCTNLSKGSGCFQCRCSNECKKHPNTRPVTKADGSCNCVPNLTPLQKCQNYCKTGGGTARIVNGNCQCTAPAYYCPYSGCANEKTRTSCFMCRCRNFCRSRPGTYPSVKADGSCTCPRISNIATVNSYNTRPNEAMDEGMFGVPSIA